MDFDNPNTKLILIGGGVIVLLLLLWWLWRRSHGDAPSAPQVKFGQSPNGAWAFMWTTPSEGSGSGYNLGFHYELRDPSQNIIVQDRNTTQQEVLIPLPYQEGFYTIAVLAHNQFGNSIWTLSSGSIPIPSVVSFEAVWNEGCSGPHCDNRPWWDLTLQLMGGPASAISFSAVLANGDYMPEVGNVPVHNFPMVSKDGLKWTAPTPPMPKLKPPFPDGLSRGTPFTWVVLLEGSFGSLKFTKDDAIPGQSPSAPSIHWGPDPMVGSRMQSFGEFAMMMDQVPDAPAYTWD